MGVVLVEVYGGQGGGGGNDPESEPRTAAIWLHVRADPFLGRQSSRPVGVALQLRLPRPQTNLCTLASTCSRQTY